MPTSKKKAPAAASGRKRPRGRPTKYTPDVGARIVVSVQHGATWETAASAAGVSRDSLHRWLREGARSPVGKPAPVDEQGRPTLATLRHFSDAITRAEDAGEVRWLGLVNKGAAADARHAEWLLTHHPRTRDRYADPAHRIIHSGGTTNTNVTIDAGAVDLSTLSDAELDALDALTAKALRRVLPAPSSPPPPAASTVAEEVAATVVAIERARANEDDEEA